MHICKNQVRVGAINTQIVVASVAVVFVVGSAFSMNSFSRTQREKSSQPQTTKRDIGKHAIQKVRVKLDLVKRVDDGAQYLKEEMKIPAPKIQKLVTIAKEFEKKQSDLLRQYANSPDIALYRRKSAKIALEVDSRFKEVLTKTQATRLDQIAAQVVFRTYYFKNRYGLSTPFFYAFETKQDESQLKSIKKATERALADYEKARRELRLKKYNEILKAIPEEKRQVLIDLIGNPIDR